MVDPPFDVGADHVIVTCSFAGVTVDIVGALAMRIGVTDDEAAE
jgi:hypothetical protein